MPKILAGAGAEATLPVERPSPGYRLLRLSTDGLRTPSCIANPFKQNCTATTSAALMAVSVDESCVVRAFILGDKGCSIAEDLAVVQG